DGIRDGHVTGVQTCALPIYPRLDVRLAKRLVGERRPALAQGEVFLTMIGQLTAAPLDGGDVETGFGAEPRGRHLARGGQQVGVVVARVAPLARLVNSEIDGYLVALGNLP